MPHPSEPTFLNNLGLVLEALHRPHGALRCFDAALATTPEAPDILCNKAEALLALGWLDEGFRGYENRWRLPQRRRWAVRTASMLWNGTEPVCGKTVLLAAEQGYGDAIQFMRYATLVAARGARVVLQVPDALRTLARTVSGVSEVIGSGDAIPEHDMYCPLMSLPAAFKTTLDSIPATVPYVRIEPASQIKWERTLGSKRKVRVGLTWAGSQARPINRARDISLSHLQALWDLDVEFVSLQKDIPWQDRPLLEQSHALRRCGESVADFADTAGLISCLDLVLSADTAVAHLAGALNKPVWILNRYASCWRWLQERDDSPWYPSARLFRQEIPGDWEAVVLKVKCALIQLLSGTPAKMMV
jgi:hypothetical protein